jgi:hypothetical protein
VLRGTDKHALESFHQMIRGLEQRAMLGDS